jgi:2-keto-3-deoxy-L-rhamnonate aldolase RhmA
MDHYTNRFKRALVEGRTGVRRMAHERHAATRGARRLGFDFLVVDMEHTPLETHHMIDTLRAIAARPRPPSCACRGTTW